MNKDHELVSEGAVILAKLYSPEPIEQANTIANVLIGKHDDAIVAGFAHFHGEEAGQRMLDELKTEFRSALQFAISKEVKEHDRIRAEEAAEQFMGSHEPHALGTVAELSEKYGVSKKHIRKLKQSGGLEDFINAQV